MGEVECKWPSDRWSSTHSIRTRNTIRHSVHIYTRVYAHRNEGREMHSVGYRLVIGNDTLGGLNTLQSAYITASFTRDWTRRHWNFMHDPDRPIGFSGLVRLPCPINIGIHACLQSIRILFETVPIFFGYSN